MNVLLFNPSGKIFNARSSRWGGKVNRSGVIVPPIFLATACGLLLKNNIDTKIIDAAASRFSWKELDKWLDSDSLVVFEVSTPSINNDSKIAHAIKQRYRCKIVYAGWHVSALPQETLKDYPVDFVCIGEYEFTLLELCQILKQGQLKKDSYIGVKGLAFSNEKGDTVINAPRELIDLDTLPFPSYEQLPINKYHDPITRRRPYMSILSSRGCPYKCAFCIAPQVIYGHRVRYRNPAKVADEIQLLKERFGVKEIFFDDDTFTLNKDHVLSICSEIKARRIHIEWSCFARTDTIDETMLSNMKEANCYMLRFGIETLDDAVLSRIGKDINIETIKKSLLMAKDYGMKIHATVMFGYPGETKETIARTLNFIKKSDIDFAQFSIATPYPGTQFYKECKEKNLLTSNNWDDYDGTSNTVVKLNSIEPDYLKDTLNRAYREFYFRRSYILKKLASIKSLDEIGCNLRSAFHLVKSQFQRFAIVFLCLFIVSGCYRNVSYDIWLRSKFSSLQKAVSSSKAWLDTVNADPLELRRYGIKGKKKTVELFEAYLAVYRFMPDYEKKSINRRLNDIFKITQSPDYHNMLSLDEHQFAEDATSYLRLCYLMELRGFDTTNYRQEIKKILPRLNAHMANRGPNQQMTFHQYYNHFHLEEPFALNEAYKKGVIKNRWDPEAMNDRDIYSLTHEIFASFEYENKNFLTDDDKIYINGVLKKLTIRYIHIGHQDLVAELISSMHFLGMQLEPIFRTAVDYLFSSQNKNGSFGNFENMRFIYEDYVKEGYYLHTTSVVVKALGLVFKNTYLD